jgi:two-component sensor histidine kinase
LPRARHAAPAPLNPERLRDVALGTFLEKQCGQLFEALGETPGKRVALAVSAPDLTLGSDDAVPRALIITEAVTNAVKYAFPEGRGGTVSVAVRREGETLTLTVRDDGIGIDASQESEEVERGGGLGRMLIDSFAPQLGATLVTESSADGTELRLTMLIRWRANGGRRIRPKGRPDPLPCQAAGAAGAVRCRFTMSLLSAWT